MMRAIWKVGDVRMLRPMGPIIRPEKSITSHPVLPTNSDVCFFKINSKTAIPVELSNGWPLRPWTGLHPGLEGIERVEQHFRPNVRQRRRERELARPQPVLGARVRMSRDEILRPSYALHAPNTRQHMWWGKNKDAKAKNGDQEMSPNRRALTIVKI